jgi:hypothetical protein
MKIGRAASELPNRVEGVLFNDYALGSRIQYQVRAADDREAHWLVERLQDDPLGGRARRAGDHRLAQRGFHSGERVSKGRGHGTDVAHGPSEMDEAAGPAVRAAGVAVSADRICRAPAHGDRLQLHAAADVFAAAGADTGELRHGDRGKLLRLVPLVAAARLAHRAGSAAGVLSDRLRHDQAVPQMGRDHHRAGGAAAAHLGEHPAVRLGPDPAQERNPRRHPAGALRPLGLRPAL